MKKSVTGQYRHKVTLQYQSGSIKEGNLEKPNYVDGATVWASVEPLRVRELFEAQMTQSLCTTLIKIRYISGIDPAWRIKYENIVYEITGIIDPDMRHRELQFMCKVVE